MAKISRDYSGALSTTLHPRENLVATGNIAALNGEVAIDADGASTISLVVTGTYVGTLTVEGTIDGANYDTIPVRVAGTAGGYILTLASAAVGRWHGPCGWARRVRVRMSAYTSGTAAIVLVADNGIIESMAVFKPTDQHGTATGVAAAAVTLTIAAGGAGLIHHISRLVIQRHATAALTAAATPTIVTTTNLPGSRAFSIPVEAAAQGTVYQEVLEPAVPIRATAANTATTIVCPATTGVIWRVSADYYLAP